MVTRSHVPQFQRPDTGDAFASGARLIWVDIAKGFGIILVVIGHLLRGLTAAGVLTWTPVATFVDSWIYCVSYAVVLLPIRLISFSIGG